MNRRISLALLLAALVVPAAGAGAQAADSMRALPAIPLWAAGAPGAKGDSTADRPVMTPYLPPAGRANGTAVVVFPGGGYQNLAMDHEGLQVARWLTSLGVTAFVSRYRLGPRYQHPAMLQDAQRALRIVRARAKEWGVDTARIGVLGFSAGGHLASTAGTQFADAVPGSADALERVTSRPDFMLLIYPVITMSDPYVHRGSRRNLLGAEPTDSMIRALSSEQRVTPRTPPTFLVHSTDDAGVPVENSLAFFRAVKGANVPVELHVFEKGRHGFGLGGTDPALSTWPSLAATWMRRHGWIR